MPNYPGLVLVLSAAPTHRRARVFLNPRDLAVSHAKARISLAANDPEELAEVGLSRNVPDFLCEVTSGIVKNEFLKWECSKLFIQDWEALRCVPKPSQISVTE